MRLNGKVAIVTGAGGGFGEGIAKRYAAEGAKVAVLDLRGDAAERVAAEIGESAIAIAADVGSAADVAAAVARTTEAFGTPHILVNNAGTTHRNQPLMEVDEEAFDRVFRVNVKSIFHFVRALAPAMRDNGGGVILNVGSTAIVYNTTLSNRIYFPRAVLPLISVVSNLYSVAITLVILVGLCIGFGVSIGPEIVLLIPGVLLVAVLAGSFALVFSALHVYFRDIRFMVSAALTVWLYVTPVIFQVQQLPRVLRPLIKVNPMTGVVELFRYATVGASRGWQTSLLITGVWVVVLLVAALQLHRRFDRLFADRI